MQQLRARATKLFVQQKGRQHLTGIATQQSKTNFGLKAVNSCVTLQLVSAQNQRQKNLIIAHVSSTVQPSRNESGLCNTAIVIPLCITGGSRGRYL